MKRVVPRTPTFSVAYFLMWCVCTLHLLSALSSRERLAGVDAGVTAVAVLVGSWVVAEQILRRLTTRTSR
jgi:hypothetical protein